MKFVQHSMFPRAALPTGITPIESSRIDDLTRAMHVVRLVARRGVRNFQVAVDSELVLNSGRPVGRHSFKPPASNAGEWMKAARICQAHLNRLCLRSP